MPWQVWDQMLLLWINGRWAAPLLDIVMPAITYLGSAYAVAAMVVIFGVRLRRRGECMRAVVAACLCLALVYGVVAGAYNGVKHGVLRQRPFVTLAGELRVSTASIQTVDPAGSFPSGHAANAFMLALWLTAVWRRWRLVFLVAAAVVALSRVYLGLHYPSDVLAGAMLGAGLTWGLLRLPWLAQRLKMGGTDS